MTGERDKITAPDVTALDFFRVLVRRQLIHPQAPAATLNALSQITGKPNQTIAEAVGRLTDCFHALVVDRDHPHPTETIFYWRHVLENKLGNIMRRLGVILKPKASEYLGQETMTAHQIAEELKSIPVVFWNSIGSAMCERGRTTLRTSENLVDVLRSGDADSIPLQRGTIGRRPGCGYRHRNPNSSEGLAG